MKNGGAVAGPKQMLGQQMFKRMHTKSEWTNLFCCGESTVMGTGTPAVTVSGIAAANAVLKKQGLKPFVYQKNIKNYVRLLDKPVIQDMLFHGYSDLEKNIMHKALQCRLCENPTCIKGTTVDIRGIMRRVAVGNFKGAIKCWKKAPVEYQLLSEFESSCIRGLQNNKPIPISEIIAFLEDRKDENIV